MATDGVGNGRPPGLPGGLSPLDTLGLSGLVGGAGVASAAVALTKADPRAVGGAAGAMGAGMVQGQLQALQTAGQLLLSAAGTPAGKPKLAGFDPALANSMDESQITAVVELLGAKTNEQSIKSLATEMRSNKANMQRQTDERVKAIQDAAQKAMEAAQKEGGFWSKLFGVLGKILGPVTSLLSIAAGVALMGTGVGAVAGLFLISNGVMGVASTAMDIVDAVREKMGKEPIGWRPSWGTFVAKGLEAVGVDKDVAGKIGMGFEIVATVAAVVATAGASAAGNAVSKAGNAMSSMAKSATGYVSKIADKADALTKATNNLRRGAEIIKGGANFGKQVVNIQVASLMKDSAMFEARAEELKGRVTKLLKQISFDTGLVKDLTERIKEINETVADSVSSRAQVGVAVAQNIRISG